jgi:hypothetical protein
MAMADTDGMNRAERESYWRERIAACAASGMSAVRYCRGADIAVGRFHRWKGELRRRNAAAVLPALFAEVRSVPRSGMVPPPCVEVALAGDRTVRVPAGFDAATLARVVRVLEGR